MAKVHKERTVMITCNKMMLIKKNNMKMKWHLKKKAPRKRSKLRFLHSKMSPNQRPNCWICLTPILKAMMTIKAKRHLWVSLTQPWSSNLHQMKTRVNCPQWRPRQFRDKLRPVWHKLSKKVAWWLPIWKMSTEIFNMLQLINSLNIYKLSWYLSPNTHTL